MQLSRFPRVRLAHLPTPLEPLERLSDHLGGPRIYVKRDDCTGLATGGNKTRKLEFLIAEAIGEGADTIVTTGGIQSNHVRQTAAAAAKSGLACELVLARNVGREEDDYERTGNIFLDRLLGATIHIVPGDVDRWAEMERVAAGIEERGGRPYLVPGGGSNALGGLGYAGCAFEIVSQANALDLAVDAIVVASGSGGTQGGLVAGLVAASSGIPAIGIDIDADAAGVPKRVGEVAAGTAELLGVRGGIEPGDVIVNSDYSGAAYGQPTPGMIEAVRLLARLEGLILDPVYSGKAMAGLIDLVGKGSFKSSDTVVFIHTGGTQALYGYRSVFEEP